MSTCHMHRKMDRQADFTGACRDQLLKDGFVRSLFVIWYLNKIQFDVRGVNNILYHPRGQQKGSKAVSGGIQTIFGIALQKNTGQVLEGRFHPRGQHMGSKSVSGVLKPV
jgi:hypothetical protein